MNEVRIWVHPSFKKKLKREAVEKEVSVLKLTKKYGDEFDEFLIKMDKKRGKGFDFKI